MEVQNFTDIGIFLKNVLIKAIKTVRKWDLEYSPKMWHIYGDTKWHDICI